MDARIFFESKSEKDIADLPAYLRSKGFEILYLINKEEEGWNLYDQNPQFKSEIDKSYYPIDIHHRRLEAERRRIKRRKHITLENYFSKADSALIACLPDHLRAEHVYIKVISEYEYRNRPDWETYKTNPDVDSRIDDYLFELNEWINKNGMEREDRNLGSLAGDDKKERIYVNSLSYDQVILYKFLHLKLKKSTYRIEVRELLNYIRRLLVQRKIGKDTRNITLIHKIQDYLILCFKNGKPKDVTAPDAEEFLVERLKPEVLLLKRYIFLGGRSKKGKGGLSAAKRDAEEILYRMTRLGLQKSDSHYEEIQDAIANLFLFLDTKGAPLALQKGKAYSLSGFVDEDRESEDILNSYEQVETLCCRNY